MQQNLRKTKSLTWAERIAEAIEEAETFDLSEDKDGFPTVHWLMAQWMLKEFDLFTMTQNMGHYVGKIKHSLYYGIELLENRTGKSVWIKRQFRRKAIQAISINPKYAKADAERMKSHWLRAIKNGKDRINKKHPELLPGNTSRRIDRFVNDAGQLPLIPWGKGKA